MAGEKQFENKIKKFLKDNGCWFVKYFANRNTRSGVPDILACVNGYFVAIEVKGEKGTPSELQLWNRDKIREAGGIAIVLYPEQFERFKEGIIKPLQLGLYIAAKINQKEFDKNNAITS